MRRELERKYGGLVRSTRGLAGTAGAGGVDRTDALLAAALLVVGALEARLGAGTGEIAAFAPIPAFTLPLAYRRRAPAAVALVVTGGIVGPVIVGSAVLLERTFTGFICLLIASYTLGRREEGRVFALSTVACAGAFAVTIGVNDGSMPSGALAAMLVFAAIAGGRIVRDRSRLVEVLEQQARELDAAARLRVETAAARERDRISNELADMVSQGVSEMVLQVRAARQVAAVDPRSAIASIEAVEATGRQALGEMRRLLGALRRGDEALALAPQPTLARLEALVERARLGGRAVELSVEGELVPLPPGVDAAAYRIVEEVLAAAERQGAAGVGVRVRHTRHVLELEMSSEVRLSRDVAADGPTETTADGSGETAGMVGIRERVAAFGGETWTGPTSNGYVLRTRLPVSGRPVGPGPVPRPARATGGRGARLRSGSWRGYRPTRSLRSQAGDFAVLALSVTAVAEAATTPGRQGSPLDNAFLSAAVAAPLLLGRSRPVLASAVAWTAASVMGAFLTPVSEAPSLFVVLLLYPYMCARYAPRRGAHAGLAASLAGVLVLNLGQGTVAWGDLAFPPLLLWLSWFVGRTARSRALMAREVAERAQQLEQARDEQAAAAASAERSRIARELHDIVAHTLSVMVVQAGAARWTFECDRARASDALAIVEETGCAALVELRRLLGFLTPVESAEALGPRPGLAQLQELVDRTRRAGMPVELRIRGEPCPLPAGLDLAVYRIAQEALTNALRHAGRARAQVVVRYAEQTVSVEVVDDGRGRHTKKGGDKHGHGLAGMRERVAVHGGELFAGPLTGGGFAVRAQLPVPQGSAPPAHVSLVDDAGISSPAGTKDGV